MKTLNSALAEELFKPTPGENASTYKAIDHAQRILAPFMKYRRMVRSPHRCTSNYCPECASRHLSKITSATKRNEKIQLILPAFPGKSPNPSKVAGILPDLAEVLALRFLNNLCKQVGEIYGPGAEIIICSDGRVFSDIVGINEEDITAYQNRLDDIIEEHQLEHLSTFNLDELIGDLNFDEIRSVLMAEYGQSLKELQEKVRRGSKDSMVAEDVEANRMYCGITRFLFEDALIPGQSKSKTSIQKESRAKAYEVIRRSNAWSKLLGKQFPKAVRLSIHPQTCGAKKLGIRLLGNDPWMTPWHGVAVNTGKEFLLMKKWEAEEQGYVLINDRQGNSSHYAKYPQIQTHLQESDHGL